MKAVVFLLAFYAIPSCGLALIFIFGKFQSDVDHLVLSLVKYGLMIWTAYTQKVVFNNSACKNIYPILAII